MITFKMLRLGHCSYIQASELQKKKSVSFYSEPGLLNELMTILPELQTLGVTIWVHGRLEEALPAVVSHLDTRSYSADQLPKDVRKQQKPTDMAVFIFTSGTTGKF